MRRLTSEIRQEIGLMRETLDPTFLSASVASFVGSLLTMATNVATQLFGMPLPVVLAAAAGAFLARSYMPATSFLRAIGMSGVWTTVGCALAPILPGVLSKFGIEVSASAMAGSALLIAAGAPMLWPIVVDKAPQIAKRWLDKLSGSNKDGQA